MKRTGKKDTTLENPGTKVKNQASANRSKPEKPVVSKNGAVAKSEKIVKKLKPEPAVKISAPPKAKKPVSAKKPEKAVAQKTKPAATEKKTTEKSNLKSAVKSLIPTPKTKKAATKTVKQTQAPTPQKKSASAGEKLSKKDKPAVSVSNPKAKKPPAVSSEPKPKKDKIVQPAATKKSKPGKTETSLESAAKKIKKSAKKVEIIVPAINQKRSKTVQTVEKKAVSAIPVAKSKVLKKAETAAKKIVKKSSQKIEIVIPPIVAKPVKKRPSKPIGSAVVRGKSGRYDFEVFPLDADLKDGSAIYVISKRITDKRGRGHHKFVCIGQTESLLGEIKKHKKDKCIKQHKANVICLLREESEPARMKIETDLREAHTIVCNQK